jgi:hypothetical protein
MATIPLPLHLLIHFALAALIGYLVGRPYQKIWPGIIGGILGGFLIDLDHFLEYFLVFGLHFNFLDFCNGQQFLVSGQIHIWFHAWEYVPILFLITWLCRRQKAVAACLLALTLGVFVHLVSDCLIDHYPPRNYSLIYRCEVNFSAAKLLDAEQYAKYLQDRKAIGL